MKYVLSLIIAFILVGCISDPQDDLDPASSSSKSTSYSPVATPVHNTLYGVVVGGICEALDVKLTNYGSTTGTCQSDATASFVNWCATCNISSMHLSEYDYLTSSEMITIMHDKFRFDYKLASDIMSQAERCGSAFYLYSATSGLNFLYIERMGDSKGLMKRGL